MRSVYIEFLETYVFTRNGSPFLVLYTWLSSATNWTIFIDVWRVWSEQIIKSRASGHRISAVMAIGSLLCIISEFRRPTIYSKIKIHGLTNTSLPFQTDIVFQANKSIIVIHTRTINTTFN